MALPLISNQCLKVNLVNHDVIGSIYTSAYNLVVKANYTFWRHEFNVDLAIINVNRSRTLSANECQSQWDIGDGFVYSKHELHKWEKAD